MSSEQQPSERSRLLRAAADERLSRADELALSQHLERAPQDAQAIEFERRLRTELRRVMREPEPAQLEQHVAALAESARSNRGPRQLVRRLSRPLLGAAASVLVLLGAWFFSTARRASPFLGERDTLVRYFDEHPRECEISAERTLSEFKVARFDQALSTVGAILGRAPELAQLESQGLEFIGMGRCGVPGGTNSMHLVFRGRESTDLAGAMLSVYVQSEDGRLQVENERTYQLEPRGAADDGLQIYLWRRAGLDYFVVTHDARVSQVALASVQAPRVVGAF